MLAELVDHVIGVDPDRDWITIAAVDAHSSGVVATGRFPAERDGYRDAIEWADAHSIPGERAWVIEGTASYGRGLCAALQRHDELVVEFDRPTRKATKDGAKSDALDAERAAREALGREQLCEPRAHDGIREAIRVHAVARAAAVRARTAAINELKALVVTADETLKDRCRCEGHDGASDRREDHRPAACTDVSAFDMRTSGRGTVGLRRIRRSHRV